MLRLRCPFPTYGSRAPDLPFLPLSPGPLPIPLLQMHHGGAATGGADPDRAGGGAWQDGGGAGGRRGADTLRAGGRRRCGPAAGEALRAGGRGRRCGDGLAVGGAAALAPQRRPGRSSFFSFLSEFFIFYVKKFLL